MDHLCTNLEEPKSIGDEICSDHARIMGQLEALIDCRAWKKGRSRQLFALIGAHHLAEEETLYSGLFPERSQSVGQALAFHAVLDDLIHNIEKNQGVDSSLQYELLLLHHLLGLHFDAEEAELLELFVEQNSVDFQFRLGQEYRATFTAALEELQFDANPTRNNRSSGHAQVTDIRS